jgi:hypothetical protein
LPTFHLYSHPTPVEKRAAVDEVERLKSMAQKLRAEVAALEDDRAQQELASIAESAFRQFDTNQDGEISVNELKGGLENRLKWNCPTNGYSK